MSLVYIIEDDMTMAECIALSVRAASNSPAAQVFHNAIEAMQGISQQLPDAILLDVLLDGPDGFTFLNELISYQDTARIPVVLISSLDFSNRNLSHYGVVQVLQKSTMTPEDIQLAVINALASGPQTPPAIAPLSAEIAPTATSSAPSPISNSNPPSSISALNQKLAAASETPTPDEPADA